MAKLALQAMTATEAKNNFGALLDSVIEKGKIAITKHDEVSAVVLSRREYELLLENQHDPLRELRQEFDGLVERMQRPSARRAGKALFDATPARLGRAAVASARRRG
jgi:prevent-host-death family protein